MSAATLITAEQLLEMPVKVCRSRSDTDATLPTSSPTHKARN